MMKKGSITIFLALILSVIISLISSGIHSARMAAARTQILNSVDVGLYSLFGQFDKKLLKDYDLFFLDGSYGGGNLDLASVYDSFEKYMKPALKEQKTQKFKIAGGGFTAYSLATDKDGQVFYQQIIRYMKETLGSQGIQLFLERMQSQKNEVKKAENQGNQLENQGRLDSYEQEMDLARQKSEAAKEAAKEAGNTQVAVVTPAANVENPIPVIKRIRKMNILDLVIPFGKQISNKAADKRTLVSGRQLQKGMNVDLFAADHNNASDSLLYQEYLRKKMGSFQSPSLKGLDYEMEYILWGKDSDEKNLKETATKLLLIREGINFACLTADAAKMAQIKSLALAVASLFLVPPVSVVIESAIVLCWSFAESILDVRNLFAGGKVPLIKTPNDWQISLENLPYLLSKLDSSRKNPSEGMSYEDYLQVMLLSVGTDKKIIRGMDMIELAMQKTEGYSGFKFDSCIAAVELSVDVNANKMKTYNVTRQYCYD